MTTSERKIEIERIKEADIPLLNTFYQEHFPDKKKLTNKEVWLWEYTMTPNLKNNEIPVFLIRHGDMIHGAIGAIHTNIQIGKEVFSACHPADFFVAKEYKGLPALRLFRKILAESDIHFASYISHDAAKLCHAAGFKDLNQHLKSYRYTLSRNRSKSPLATKISSLPIRAIRYLLRKSSIIFYNITSNGHYESTIMDSITAEVIPKKTQENLFERIGIVKDFSYLDWRYNKSPALKCKIFSQYKNGKPNNLVIVHEIEKSKNAVILDIVRDTDNTEDASRALINVIEHYTERGFNDLSTVILSKSLHKALLQLGFHVRDSGNRLMYHAKDASLKNKLSNPSQWDFHLGDTDAY